MSPPAAPPRPTPAPFGWAESMFTVGVTGTNGKTSTTRFVAHVFRAAGHPTVEIGTLGYRIDDERLEVPRTLQGFYDTLKAGCERGARHAAIETTSRALAQGYAARWRFDLGVFTNLSADHLETHGSWEHYLASKAQLFIHLGPGRTAVLNGCDPHAVMLEQAIPKDVHRWWFGSSVGREVLRPLDLEIVGVDVGPEGTEIALAPGSAAERLGGSVRIALVGSVFAENAIAAALAGLEAGIEGSAVVRGLAACPPIPGRFEVVARRPVVAVDYAHTPEALARTCDTARQLAHRAEPRGRVVVVFGAGGDSSPDKRIPMGEAVGRGADRVFVTNDNPRHEDPQAIADSVRRGCERGGRADVTVLLDRYQAIAAALDEAQPGDVVLIAGKGHETGQQVGDEVVPFSDREVVRSILGLAEATAGPGPAGDA